MEDIKWHVPLEREREKEWDKASKDLKKQNIKIENLKRVIKLGLISTG